MAKLARRHGVHTKARTFSPWSHVVALLYAQFTHSMSLNDVCDALRHHGSKLLRARKAAAPSKNALSHANRGRSGAMAEELFWETLKHLKASSPGFGGKTFKVPGGSIVPSMRWTPRLSRWWLTVWTGRVTVGARRRPSCTCA